MKEWHGDFLPLADTLAAADIWDVLGTIRMTSEQQQ